MRDLPSCQNPVTWALQQVPGGSEAGPLRGSMDVTGAPLPRPRSCGQEVLEPSTDLGVTSALLPVDDQVTGCGRSLLLGWPD